MRCPKCSYISFDQQHSCRKCGHDLSELSVRLKGTTSRAGLSSFLQDYLARQEPLSANQDSGSEESLIIEDTEPLEEAEPGLLLDLSEEADDVSNLAAPETAFETRAEEEELPAVEEAVMPVSESPAPERSAPADIAEENLSGEIEFAKPPPAYEDEDLLAGLPGSPESEKAPAGAEEGLVDLSLFMETDSSKTETAKEVSAAKNEPGPEDVVELDLVLTMENNEQ